MSGSTEKRQLESAFYDAVRRMLGRGGEPAEQLAKPAEPPRPTRGIAFSGPLVRAMLEGRKNQTRRPVSLRVTDPHPAGCPIAKPGEWLTVREPWRDTGNGYEYAADDLSRRGFKPGRYMPRDAARLLLHVTAVEVQRAHDITNDDARMEGAPTDLLVEPRAWFANIWGNFYDGPMGWAANPWLWVIRFDVAQKDGVPVIATGTP
ncbi:MAG: hypothetical protein AAF743_07770 [Planctomycetota bacterium]